MIEWTDRVWNPVRGCSRISEGCRNCYAERIAARFSGAGKPFAGFARQEAPHGPVHPDDLALWEPKDRIARWTGKVALVPEKLNKPLHWRKPARVFVNSMSDLFHEKLSDKDIGKVFGIMADPCCHKHTFQILTKRPKRMLEWFKEADFFADYPRPHIWLGVSVEDQATANERIPLLLHTPAAVRFVSYEPALGPVDFTRILLEASDTPKPDVTFDALRGWYAPTHGEERTRIDWLIYGGESGPRARPNDIEWARSARDQCKAAGVAFFMKQAGRWLLGDNAGFDVKDWLLADGTGFAPPIIGPHANERPANAIGFSLYDVKGGDPAEWPEDLRVREFPT
jgi:protein gp37